MEMVFRWLRKHQIAGFFLFVFVISWGSWILGFVLFSEDELLQAPFFKIGVFAPAGVAILVSSLINREPSGAVGVLKRVIFGAVWLAAWLHIVLYAHVTSGLLVNAKVIVVGGFIAILPACVISNAFSSNNAVQKLLVSIIKPRGNPLGYLFAVLFIPMTMALGNVISLAIGKNPAINGTINLR